MMSAKAFASLLPLPTGPTSPENSGGRRALTIAGSPAEIALTAVTPHTLRVSVVAKEKASQPRSNLVLVHGKWPKPLARLRATPEERALNWGELRLRAATEPLSLSLFDSHAQPIQSLRIDPATGRIEFALGNGPLLGLGEGGPQFDRRGSLYPMQHGQHVPDLALNGARLPIPWIIGSSGWALFFHQPYGTLDLRSTSGVFAPLSSAGFLPIDFLVVASSDPQVILREYAQLVGFPHLPPLWSLGYQQSHRTLASREEVLSEAKRFRGQKLPCDVLIYLGTGFCPSGWNTGHGSITFNPQVFEDPERMLQELHQEHFRVVLHVVNPPPQLEGSVHDRAPATKHLDHAAAYWNTHAALRQLGVDGWWADEGDRLSAESCLVRNRMYWEGQIMDRPNRRPYTLHRNGYAGLQRYGWLWSGDIDSTWEALRRQIAVGINTGLSGIPYWGTDTGGFVPTRELTGELYVRWFQFSAFCPLFRSHGRAWKLRLPWGWNTGDYGPTEIEGYDPPAGLPDPSALRNPQVEPICRKYLDLRYRLLPYLYSVVRESHDTGLAIMRALWIHYPDDPQAVARGDEYLWGKDMLVAPVTEKGAAARLVYLPHGEWFDFWTEEKVRGGREIKRAVDLATLPLYVRSGAILPLGPPKQFALQDSSQPLSVVIYPGTNGEFVLYEDDGQTFDFSRGQAMWLGFRWDEQAKRVSIGLRNNSKLLPPIPRELEFRLAAQEKRPSAVFDGNPLDLPLQES
jgi:alpha-glucosidase/alpha-D-xyloside xylohydrolase